MINSLLKDYTDLPKEIYILAISKTINSLGNFILPLLTLILTQKIMLPKDAAGLYLTILSICYAPGLILGGKLVDVIGRKRIIIIFHTIAAILYASCGFINPSIIMIYILILASTSLAITLPAYDALVADLTNPHNRKRAYSLIYMGHNLGFAIAPIIGGLLYKKYLSLVFICDALSTIISVILISVYIKDYYRNNKKSKDIFSKSEKSNEEALIKILFNRRILLYFAIVLFCYNFAYSQWGFAMPLQLVEIFNEKGSSYYGFLAGFNGLLILVSTPFITRYTQRIKTISVIAIGGILYAVAFSILAYTNLLVVFFLSVSIMTFGEVMISVNASTFVANNTPATHRGRVNAVIPMIYGAGFTLGPLAMGGILRRYELKQAWLFVSCIVLFAGVVMFIMGKITRKKFANLV